mmetsp:Transcript_114355/g.160502  ORF Transcript_114355/g.160502 Transcript_114355/m.160502 type:complete len:218 (-) Transcript_114355:121-774(-)
MPIPVSELFMRGGWDPKERGISGLFLGGSTQYGSMGPWIDHNPNVPGGSTHYLNKGSAANQYSYQTGYMRYYYSWTQKSPYGLHMNEWPEMYARKSTGGLFGIPWLKSWLSPMRSRYPKFLIPDGPMAPIYSATARLAHGATFWPVMFTPNWFHLVFLWTCFGGANLALRNPRHLAIEKHVDLTYGEENWRRYVGTCKKRKLAYQWRRCLEHGDNLM